MSLEAWNSSFLSKLLLILEFMNHADLTNLQTLLQVLHIFTCSLLITPMYLITTSQLPSLQTLWRFLHTLKHSPVTFRTTDICPVSNINQGQSILHQWSSYKCYCLRFPHGLTVSNVGLPLSRDVPFPRQRSSATPVTSPVPEFSGNASFVQASMTLNNSGVPNSRNRMSDIGRVHSAPPAVRRHHDNRDQTYPSSPPPAYEEVLKQPRLPPPSYDEAQMMQCRQER